MARKLIIAVKNRNRDEFPITVNLPYGENTRWQVQRQLNELQGLAISADDAQRFMAGLEYLPHDGDTLAYAETLYQTSGKAWDECCLLAKRR